MIKYGAQPEYSDPMRREWLIYNLGLLIPVVAVSITIIICILIELSK